MDVNATLKQLRELAADIARNDASVAESHRAEDFAELFQALDTWLCRGGFLPKPWERTS